MKNLYKKEKTQKWKNKEQNLKKLFVCGKNSVFDAIKNGFNLEKIFVNNEVLAHKIKKYGNFDIETKDETFFLDFKDINHQGIVAFLKEFPIHDLQVIQKDKPNFVLMLDKIQDPHNLGAIIRTANALGVKHVIMTKEKSADITSSVLKISSGGFIGMKIIKSANLVSSIKKLKEFGYWIYASALSEKAKEIDDVNYNFPICLIVGNEGDGVSLPVLKQADELIYIKQYGTVQSLNVSVATGILLNSIVKKGNE